MPATVSTPLWGRVSDLCGRKALFQASIAIFLAGSALSGVAATLGAGTTAHAADFTVNAGDDAGDGTCDPVPGGCTLRDALDDAAANDNSPTVDQILFDSSVTGTNERNDPAKAAEHTTGIAATTTNSAAVHHSGWMRRRPLLAFIR